jgi:hypothetical protein
MALPFMPAPVLIKRAPVAFSFVQGQNILATTYNLGTPTEDRIVIFTCSIRHSTAAGTITGVTMNGTPMTLAVNSVASLNSCAIFYAVVPTGATATFAGTYSTAALRGGAAVSVIYGAKNIAPTNTNRANNNSSVGLSIPLDVQEGGVSLYGFNVGDPGVITWTGATSLWNASSGASHRFSSAYAPSPKTQNGVIVSAKPYASDYCTMVGAHWR